MKTFFAPIMPILILVPVAYVGGVDEAASGTVIGKIDESNLVAGKSPR